MKKTELLDQVVKKTGVTKVMADKVLSAVTDSIAESLADGKKGKSRGARPCMRNGEESDGEWYE